MSTLEPAEKRYRFGSTFEQIINRSKPKEQWYKVDWRSRMTARFGYQTTSILSFVLMGLFGALAIKWRYVCTVVEPTGRCCGCPDFDNPEVQLQGQSMPTQLYLNDVYYGVIMVLNSFFGIAYAIQGVRDENKFLLWAMVWTQSLECARGLLDTALESASAEDTTIRTVRTYMLYATVGVMLLSWVFLRPLYKAFGWRIFKRGGARKAVRDMYKMFQRYRALNLLDMQSSFLLFVIFFMYLDIVRWHGYWVCICFLLCDVQASRYMVKYLKREDMRGVLLSVACKLFVIAWWCLVIADYFRCWDRFEESRAATEPWLAWPIVPSLVSVRTTYSGMSCLTPFTAHDSRTYEMVALNFGQALLFRLSSLIVSVFVCRNFNRGLRDVFYFPVDGSAGGASVQHDRGEDGDPREEGLIDGTSMRTVETSPRSAPKSGGVKKPAGKPAVPARGAKDHHYSGRAAAASRGANMAADDERLYGEHSDEEFVSEDEDEDDESATFRNVDPDNPWSRPVMPVRKK